MLRSGPLAPTRFLLVFQWRVGCRRRGDHVADNRIAAAFDLGFAIGIVRWLLRHPKKLLKELPPETAMQDILFGLLDKSDQAAVLRGTAYLDHALEVLLKAKFRPLNREERDQIFDGAANGILGFISAKIRMAYALRMINLQTYQDLLLINDIRNVFAHTLHDVDFNNAAVVNDCTKLKTFKPSVLGALQETPKQRYFFTVISIYAGLRQNLLQYQLASALADRPQPDAGVPSPDKSAPRSRRNRRRRADKKARQRPPQA